MNEARQDEALETGHSDETTEGIRIRVSAQYLPERSAPERRQYLFVYRVQIENVGTAWAKLLSRRWVITDGNGEVNVVEGPGVVGETPELSPGDRHEYMSGCPLPTHWGTMEGHYVMEREDGSTFEARVGRFFLAKNTELAPSS